MVKAEQIRDLLRARVGHGRFRIADIDPDSTPGLKGGDRRALHDIKKHEDELFEWHQRLYAERKRSLLVVLQAMDTGGKDGTVTYVVRNFNPQGVMITSFKEPTAGEKRRGFLWRVRRRLPVPGDIGIFNRSHYEDVLIARVHSLAPPEVIERRYSKINAFEEKVAQGGTKGREALPSHLICGTAQAPAGAAQRSPQALEVQRARHRRARVLG